VSRREFWDLLGSLSQSGMTIVVSTPYMDEANRCDRVALIQRGRLLATDTPKGIAASFDRPLLAVHVADRYPALQALHDMPHAKAVYPFGEVLHYVDAREGAATAAVADEVHALLESRGFAGVGVEPATATVEDVFIARMGAPEGAHSA